MRNQDHRGGRIKKSIIFIEYVVDPIPQFLLHIAVVLSTEPATLPELNDLRVSGLSSSITLRAGTNRASNSICGRKDVMSFKFVYSIMLHR